MLTVDYMRRALGLAVKARGKTSPNPMVGVVVVKEGRIVAEGFHRRCGGDHAEVVALKKVGGDVKGATLYVTLEPCFHFGRTPPCVDMIIASGIRQVVIGSRDPNPLTAGKSIAKLRRAGIKVQVGVLKSEALQLNEVFFKYITTGMPFVTAKCAQTLDGKIATSTGSSKWITSVKTRRFARHLRDEFDAILVGINTVLQDDPCLSGQRKTKRLKKIILDSSLRISLRARLFNDIRLEDCIVVTTSKASDKKIRLFERKGVKIIVAPLCSAGVDLKWVFKGLAKIKITSILLEGGARVIGSALQAKVVDKMYIYIAPKLVGDQQALNAVVGLNVKDINNSVELKNLTLINIDKDILITGYV